MKKLPLILLVLAGLFACSTKIDHTAPAVNDKDSASMMISWGVNTLISDSGVMRYRMVCERWEVNTVKNPSFWHFDRGLFLEQFDENLHVQSFVECDTAWYYDQKRLWELRGNVRIRTTDGTKFYSEELYWDQLSRRLYSYQYSKLITPDSEMEGTHFESEEPDNLGRLNHYIIDNSKGFFKPSEVRGKKSNNSDMRNEPDSVKRQYRYSNSKQIDTQSNSQTD